MPWLSEMMSQRVLTETGQLRGPHDSASIEAILDGMISRLCYKR